MRESAPLARRERGKVFFGFSRSSDVAPACWDSSEPVALSSAGPGGWRGGPETIIRNSAGVDSGSRGWGREVAPCCVGWRPSLALPPQSMLQPQPLAVDNLSSPGDLSASARRHLGFHPIGGTRPRGEVLKELGPDWTPPPLEPVPIQLAGKGIYPQCGLGGAPMYRPMGTWRNPNSVAVSREAPTFSAPDALWAAGLGLVGRPLGFRVVPQRGLLRHPGRLLSDLHHGTLLLTLWGCPSLWTGTASSIFCLSVTCRCRCAPSRGGIFLRLLL